METNVTADLVVVRTGDITVTVFRTGDNVVAVNRDNVSGPTETIPRVK